MPIDPALIIAGLVTAAVVAVVATPAGRRLGATALDLIDGSVALYAVRSALGVDTTTARQRRIDRRHAREDAELRRRIGVVETPTKPIPSAPTRLVLSGARPVPVVDPRQRLVRDAAVATVGMAVVVLAAVNLLAAPTGGVLGATFDPGPTIDPSSSTGPSPGDPAAATPAPPTASPSPPIDQAPSAAVIAPIAVPRPPSLAEGTDGRDGVELELTWELGDDGGPAAAFELSVGLGDDPVRPVTTMDGSARNAVVVVEPGLTATYAIVALDAGEAPGATARWDPLTADRLQESSPTVTYGGRWRHAAGPSLSDGGVVYSRGRGAEATLQFVGTDVGWVATRTPQSGRAEVSIDGQPVGTVDLSAGSVRYRQVVFRHHLLIGGAHEMRIRAIGDRRVDVDAFLVLR